MLNPGGAQIGKPEIALPISTSVLTQANTRPSPLTKGGVTRPPALLNDQVDKLATVKRKRRIRLTTQRPRLRYAHACTSRSKKPCGGGPGTNSSPIRIMSGAERDTIASSASATSPIARLDAGP